MMIKPVVNIRCQDGFYSKGIYVIVNKIIEDTPFRLMKEFVIPDFWVFSEGSMIELLPFAKSFKKGRGYIVFCNQSCQRVLENIPGINIVCFIRIDICCIEAENILKEKLIEFVRSQSLPDEGATVTQIELLTEPQKKVIDLIARGFHPRQISALCDISVKGVSYHKRDAMRRLGVTNNQELIVKSLMLRETEPTE